jgi:hypothetical protein
MGNDHLDLVHVAIVAAAITEVTGFVADTRAVAYGLVDEVIGCPAVAPESGTPA